MNKQTNKQWTIEIYFSDIEPDTNQEIQKNLACAVCKL